MRNLVFAFCAVLLLSIGTFAQNPTLTIVTETPGLPSELWYGAPPTGVKVKPVRLRPGTNTPITIDDLDFFVQQHYIDFLVRFPDQGGFTNWMTYLNFCNTEPNPATCLYGPNGRRTVASGGFFGSQEFNQRGGFIFRLHRSTFGGAFTQLPKYVDVIAAMPQLAGSTPQEVDQKKVLFSQNWVVDSDFLNIYPRSLSPTQFVDNVSATAGVTLSNRNQIISDLTAAGNTDNARATAIRAIVDSFELVNKDLNAGFVYMQYVGYLRRDPEEQGYNNWLNYLNSHPGDYNTMVWGFVDSAEFRNRF
jgi:hypothetical protein